MESNTVEYWLNKAKEEGKGWADAALENAKEQGNLTAYATGYSQALDAGFIWARTPQVHRFWSDIFFSLST